MSCQLPAKVPLDLCSAVIIYSTDTLLALDTHRNPFEDYFGSSSLSHTWILIVSTMPHVRT